MPSVETLPPAIVRTRGLQVALATGGICALFASGVALFFSWKGQFAPGFSHNPEGWSQFGEYFGGVLGPILSSLTLVALIYTVWLQTKQIEISRDELAAARADKRQTQEQAAIATFFQMVGLHHEIVNEITMGSLHGREVLRYAFNTTISEIYAAQTRTVGMLTIQFDRSIADQFYNLHGVKFGHYFRNLYQILRFIDDNEVISDKLSLAGIMRAQLTEAELGLVFYSGISTHGAKLKPLLEKYAMFEDFNKNSLKAPDSKNDYLDPAWGDNLNTL